VVSRREHRFHDVRLSAVVQTARQALAIDERRITFAPSPGSDGGWRDGVLLADTALRHVLRDDASRAPNLGWWVAEAGGVENLLTEHVRAARGDLPGDQRRPRR
jgi:hypothetical protein